MYNLPRSLYLLFCMFYDFYTCCPLFVPPYFIIYHKIISICVFVCVCVHTHTYVCDFLLDGKIPFDKNQCLITPPSQIVLRTIPCPKWEDIDCYWIQFFLNWERKASRALVSKIKYSIRCVHLKWNRKPIHVICIIPLVILIPSFKFECRHYLPSCKKFCGQ